MTSIARPGRLGKNSTPTPEQIAIRQAAQALLEADKNTIAKSDRLFLQTAKRHGLVSREGADRIAAIGWLLNGGRP